MEPASNAKTTIDWLHRILKDERDIVISSRPLEATAFQVENIRMAYVLYENGLSINVMYTVNDGGKRAVGFKLSEGMEVPAELASPLGFWSSKHETACWRLCPVLVLRSGYPGQGLRLGERSRVGRFDRWASSPCLSFWPPLRFAWIELRARIGLCRCPAASPRDCQPC